MSNNLFSQSHGIFDIDSFLILFPNESIREEEVDLMQKAANIVHQSRNEEVFSVINILAYADLLKINLLHEEIHYWQAMTSPAIIMNYLNLSKLLFTRVNSLNLRCVFTDTFPLKKNYNTNDFLSIYYSHRMNFEAPRDERIFFRRVYNLYEQSVNEGFCETWSEYAKSLKIQIEDKLGESIYDFIAPYLHMVKGSYNVISDELSIAMPFICRPHIEQEKSFLEYGGLLDYFDIINFTGDNLMESYAIVNECIAKGISIPQYEASKMESNRYLGAYEFYRRLHAHRYANERELAISFLIVIDICFTTDPLYNHNNLYQCDEDFYQENVSIPYRFGKLVFRAQGFRPFHISTESNILSDIETWENDFCEYQGFYLPEICIRHTIEYLLTILLNDFEGVGYKISQELIEILHDFKAEGPNWDVKLNQVVNSLNSLYQYHCEETPNSGLTFQNHTILAITNALIYRLYNRGKIILSASYQYEIRHSLESPVFIVGGQYACNLIDSSSRGPLMDYSSGIYGPIENLVIKSIAKEGILSCGFRDNFYDCRYITNGYGCPLDGLSEEAKIKRRESGIDENWCHYTRIMNIIKKR